jgi:hypothetical protein
MFTADQCIAKAAELSLLADESDVPGWRESLLVMAATWLDLSRLAEWQDTHFPEFAPTRQE